ncbi:MAG: D-alanyl-D-alanine carboxypeptidase/D-alanyl-D-alanine-endopeptidase [Myxococcota bacterium]|nr:D-alanyl-D-alanine carboxypeptidase/D-alanyl-D-alanine-endopeptidase [bacterium]MDP6074709.1 D-alanyl-D-alanine carboxypeptidase/D-alanyl-D-alanine-endopeptidase [Myxococcota bacterium]MDP6243647.1 D-alanyl-D-alanine carboxypeptidase/D-alanyl-D-alanine-endopeptidase [Myxococcota bacterium]MDP7073045.1 D-alanyl-D-alanine carboxypeptidase/D-alanyl-D-alanine-endopeptidase [Myxococcota bacterium]MDP7298485.1 D-alanyl-D-alanine carboxypeptidase/D-alanyl-D-alanine-endopeptidase [Myxococcota bacter
MSARWRAALALVCVLGVMPARGEEIPGEPVRGAPALVKRLDAALAHPSLRGSQIAALVVDAETGGVLYAHDPDRALVPASNVKILTGVAVLAALGPAHRFATEVLANRVPDAEGAVDTLYVRGGGDPALTSEELWRLAADLRRGGLRKVREALVVDASLFDDERWHPSWGPVSARAYHAPIAGLTVNYAAFAARVVPGARPGDAVEVTLDPAVDGLRVVNRVRTVQRGAEHEKLDFERRRAEGFEEVLVSGMLRAGGEPVTLYRSVLDPVAYAASVLRLQLEANGVEVASAGGRGTIPEDAVALLRFEGRPLGEVVRLFMKYSNNAIGEGLVKALAARAGKVPATWPAGIAAVRDELARLGVGVEPITLVDGSGLSYANRVSPRVLVEALRLAAGAFRFGPEFVSSLPIAAADGTLEERFEGSAGAVRAKTGNLTRVTALSGYVRRADGRTAIFSLLVNGYRGEAEEVWRGVDGFAEELTTTVEGPLP